jgi:hypothetical protein
VPNEAAVIDIERIEPVRIDHPKLSDNRAAADVSLWRTAEGFECYTSFGGRIYHGVSADGRWLVLDYYPTIASGTRSSVAVWDKQFYVFYYDEEAVAARRSVGFGRPRCKQGRLPAFYRKRPCLRYVVMHSYGR